MSHFMHRLAGGAAIGQGQVLRAARHPDRAAAAGAAHEGDVTGLTLSRHPADVRARVPLGHGVANPLRIGHVGLDHVGDDAIRPAEPGAADDRGIPGGDGAASFSSELDDFAKYDIAIDDAVLSLDFEGDWPATESPMVGLLRARRAYLES